MAIQLLNKIEKARSLKLPQNSQKTSESCKTRENTSDETRDRFFRGILGEISDNFLKI